MENSLNILLMSQSEADFGERQIEELKHIVPEALIIEADRKGVTLEMIERAEIILGWPTHKQLKQAKNLKWLHLPSAGADSFTDKELYCNKDIILTNSSGVFGLPISEHVFSLILAFNRNLHIHIGEKSNKKIIRAKVNKDLNNSTIGIIGLGDIGTEVAKRAHAWGIKVIAVRRNQSAKPYYVDELYGEDGIDILLMKSDFVVLALPDTARTQGIISKERLKKMKQDAFIVNVGRGSAIDQSALIEALNENWIAGAGLDVTSPEPLPEESPLWEMSNVILTSHSSGDSPSNTERRFEIFSKNVKLYSQGKPLENVVDFKEGY
jgi:phosphoglycerate dehydrogenase-like enzyme